MLRARLATAAVAIPLLLVLILYPSPWPLAVLVFIVGIIGLDEFSRMPFAHQKGEWALTVILGTIVLLGALSMHEHMLGLSIALALILGLLWVLFTRPDFEQGLRDLGLSILGALYVGALLPHFVWLQQSGELGPRWVVFIIAVAMVGDTAGYFVGHALGRHKLTPRVSPGKTVEGTIGVVLGSLVAGVLCKLIFLSTLTIQETLLLSGAMGVLGQLGDLCESVMKRAFATKDSGWIFPGHGGVLDRIDSLLFPVIFVYYHLALFR
ncbi:MAG: phosphatidate cytidylyltransferase [Deltaproteobacteria bacterium]|nr:phosphatidate cytidylyltransferase [Deltaproteobacteria bacterium]